MNPNILKPLCKCGRKMSVSANEVATTAQDRTCRKCGARWRVVVRPVASKGQMAIHKVEMTCTRNKEMD